MITLILIIGGMRIVSVTFDTKCATIVCLSCVSVLKSPPNLGDVIMRITYSIFSYSLNINKFSRVEFSSVFHIQVVCVITCFDLSARERLISTFSRYNDAR